MKHGWRILRFAINYKGWHTYGKDRCTIQSLEMLARHGVIEINRETRQFRLAENFND